MPISSPVFKTDQINVDIVNSESVEITNLSIPSTGIEYSHALKTGLKEIIIRSRVLAKLQIAFVTTESSTKYITMKPGTVLELRDLDFSGKTIFMQSDTITSVEILELYT